MKHRLSLFLLATLSAAALPAQADVRLWLDGYGGLPEDQDEELRLNLEEKNLFGPDQRARARFDPDSRPVAGLRLRAEVDPLPMGLALDTAYRNTRSPEADLDLVPLTLAVTLPSRLTLARLGQMGSLHPTGLAGINVTSVDGNVRTGGIDSEITDNTWESSNGRAGFSTALGLEWRIAPVVSLFAEYRYDLLRFHVEHVDDEDLPSRVVDTTGRLEAHGVMLGISLRFLEIRRGRAPQAMSAAPAMDAEMPADTATVPDASSDTGMGDAGPAADTGAASAGEAAGASPADAPAVH